MNGTKPLVSVVTITYNHEKYIQQSIDSILAQKRDNYRLEIIIADDASTDETQRYIEDYSKNHPGIIKPILRKKNVGIQNNLVDALKKAKGKYVALCEGDDYWTNPDKLSQQVDLLEKNKNMTICFHPTNVFFDDRSYPDTKYPQGRTNFTPERLMSENFIPTNSVMYRRLNYDSLRNDLMPFDWYLHGYHLRDGEIGFINQKMSAYRRHRDGAWWTSHDDSTAFWNKFGPEMVGILQEFRNLYSNNATMAEATKKGEFRIINEMLQQDGNTDNLFENRRLAVDYASSASNFIHDYLKNKKPLEVKLRKKVDKLLLDNDQMNKESVALRNDLNMYIKELSTTQHNYDSLRSDLKNPLRLAKRIIKHIFGK